MFGILLKRPLPFPKGNGQGWVCFDCGNKAERIDSAVEQTESGGNFDPLTEPVEVKLPHLRLRQAQASTWLKFRIFKYFGILLKRPLPFSKGKDRDGFALFMEVKQKGLIRHGANRIRWLISIR